MSDFTPEQFKLAMAELAGLNVKGDHYFTSTNIRAPIPDCFSDLNQLMPIAWKHGISIIDMGGGFWEISIEDEDGNTVFSDGGTDPVEAIRQCLWQIYQEGINNVH